MIRQPVKVGSITAAASGVLDLSIPVGHNGTICGYFFQCFDSSGDLSTVSAVKAAVDKINLSVTHNTEGGFALLNDVSPTMLYMRELHYHSSRGLTANSTSCLHYDPSAAARAGEAASNIRNIGTKDLVDMVLRVTFASSISGVARMDVYCDIDYNLIANLGSHVRIARVTNPVTVSGGEIEITNIPKVDSSFRYEAFYLHTGGLTDMTIDEYSLVVNGSNWLLRNVPKTIIDRQLIMAERIVQTGWGVLDFAKEDNPLYFLPGGLSEIKLIPNLVAGTSAAAGTLSLWYEIMKYSE